MALAGIGVDMVEIARMEKILAEVDKYAMPSIRPHVDLKKASLGDYSNIYGSLALIKQAEKGKK